MYVCQWLTLGIRLFTHLLKPVIFTVEFSAGSSRSARLLACNFSHWRTKSLHDHGVQLCAWGATTARSVSRSGFRFGAVFVVAFAFFYIGQNPPYSGHISFSCPRPSWVFIFVVDSLWKGIMNDLIKDHCMLVTMSKWFAIWLAFCPWISAHGNARIHIFERRHGHEPMEIGRHVPVLDAVSKQTNRYHSLPNRWQSPEMCHIRLLSAGLPAARTAWNTCCRRVTSLESWVGENTLKLFPPPRDMFNGQRWLENTDLKKFVNTWIPKYSHWYAYSTCMTVYVRPCTCM